MQHDWNESLNKGKVGEELLLALWPDLERLDGRTHDLAFKSTGQTIELKTDYYPMRLTPNFFMERTSNDSKDTPGGPWQSSSDIFAYFYVKDRTLFLFERIVLVNALTVLEPQLEKAEIKNYFYTTIGYKVPRELLKDIVKMEVRFGVK